jgi:hypothetical protein
MFGHLPDSVIEACAQCMSIDTLYELIQTCSHAVRVLRPLFTDVYRNVIRPYVKQIKNAHKSTIKFPQQDVFGVVPRLAGAQHVSCYKTRLRVHYTRYRNTVQKRVAVDVFLATTLNKFNQRDAFLHANRIRVMNCDIEPEYFLNGSIGFVATHHTKVFGFTIYMSMTELYRALWTIYRQRGGVLPCGITRPNWYTQAQVAVLDDYETTSRWLYIVK